MKVIVRHTPSCFKCKITYDKLTLAGVETEFVPVSDSVSELYKGRHGMISAPIVEVIGDGARELGGRLGLNCDPDGRELAYWFDLRPDFIEGVIAELSA